MNLQEHKLLHLKQLIKGSMHVVVVHKQINMKLNALNECDALFMT